MPLNVMIVDDNPGHLKILSEGLKRIDKVNLLCETIHADFFIDQVLSKHPDLVIMDIDMPELNGIDAAKLIRDKSPQTEIVFLTSHNQFWREAFQVYAFDYLEKPLDLSRILLTINRILSRKTPEELSIEVHFGQEVRMVPLDSILFIETYKRRTLIHTYNEEIHSNLTLSECLDKLKGSHFHKTSRSYVTNVAKVESIAPESRTSYVVSFRNSDKVAYLSKKNYPTFREKIKKLHNT